jgi:hypothetical protein
MFMAYTFMLLKIHMPMSVRITRPTKRDDRRSVCLLSGSNAPPPREEALALVFLLRLRTGGNAAIKNSPFACLSSLVLSVLESKAKREGKIALLVGAQSPY